MGLLKNKQIIGTQLSDDSVSNGCVSTTKKMTKRKNQQGASNTSSDSLNHHHHDPTNPNEIIVINNKYQFRKSDTLGRGGLYSTSFMDL